MDALRRWLFGIVFTAAMALGQVALAASKASNVASPAVGAIIIGVLTIAIFLWIYSLIA